MDFVLDGLPLHPLIVHFVVAAVPAAAVTIVLAAVWPAARRRLGPLPVALAAVCAVLVPLATAAGEWLRDRLPPTPLIERHTAMGGNLLPWVLGMLVASAAVYIWHRLRNRSTTPARTARASRAASAALAVLAVTASVGSVVEVVRIGESGARAVWQGGFSEEPLER